MRLRSFGTLAALSLAMLLGACTQKNTADQQSQDAAAAAADVALGVNRFLLFPNPIGTDPFAQNGGTFETDTVAYAQAYYAAIDATNAKDTIDKWRIANGFNGFANPTRPGTEHLAVFRDVRDLGYGRRMTARRNSDDSSIAFYVENYNVAPDGSANYSSDFNVDAAIRRDTQWHVGTNAIEWTATPCLNKLNGYAYDYDPPDCDGTVKFAKYYNFSSADGTRQLSVDLDGHGKKAMPGVCISCHGGRGDPLTPPDSSGSPRFPLVENLPSRKRGDVGAHLHGQNVDSFTFSTTQAGFAKSDMQPFLKDFNQWILCTYPSPTPGATVSGTWVGSPCTRPTAGANEWQGTAAEMIQSWYGGPTMPSATFSDTYVPTGWQGNNPITGTSFTDTALYQNVVVLYCRTCHILRGTNNQNDLDFTTLAKYQGYADRIKVHVFDRGNMPLAKIPHNDFWTSPTAPQMLASFVDAQLGAGTATSGGSPLMPGHPVADPGPDRMVRTNANAVLTGENSLFASTFLWTSVSGPSAPSIDNPTGMVAIFNANTAGTYVVNLSVNGGASSKNVTITADDNFPDPLNIKFAQVKNELQNVPHVLNKRCVDCHTAISTPGQQVTTSLIPPIWYSSALAGGGDRDGDGAVTATDDAWFLKALSARVNLTEILASALLRKPTGNHHGGNQVIDVTDTTGLGGLRSYSVIYNWILAGMQPGGVAANPVIGSTTALTFSGAPLFSTGIALDASTSIGPVNYLWTVSGPLGPTGASAVIANPTSASATLFVPNTGTYVVQLRVDDGVSSDTETRTIAVTEASVVASFNPQTGPATLANVSAGRGDITLSSTSTYGTGIPLTCRWQVLSGPFGALLDGSATLDVTKSCAVPAVLNVPTSAAGSSYSVQLTASALGSISVAGPQSLTISSNSPTASLGNTPASFTVTFSANGSPVNVTSNTQQNGLGTSGTFSFNTAQASVTLQGSASLPNGSPITDYRWCLTSQPDSTNFPASIPACSNSQVSSGTSSSIAMTARATGSYTVQLTVTNGFGNSAPVTKPFTVVLPAGAVTFAGTGGIKSILGCASCHMYGNATANTLFNTASGTANVAPPWDDTNTKEGDTLYQRIRQRVNLSTPTSSLLLVCPSAGCAPGMGSYSWASGSAPYDSVRNWIQAGAPPGN